MNAVMKMELIFTSSYATFYVKAFTCNVELYAYDEV